MWLGDYTEDHATVTCMFTTHSSTGAPVAPSTGLEAADVIIYKNGSGTQKTSTNGVTMTSPFDSITGLHCVVIDTSNDTGDSGFWVAGAVYTLVLSPDETVDSVAVAKVIGQFGIELAGALRPTTASRKLDVSAGGEAGIDWANVGSPTTTLALTGTTIAATQKVDVDTIKTNPVVNGGTFTFPSNATGASTTNITAGTIATVTTVTNQLTAAQIATGVWQDTTAGDFTTALSIGKSIMNGVSLGTGLTVAAVSGAVGSVTGAVGSVTGSVGSVVGAVGSVTGNVGGNVTGSVGSVAAGGITASSFAANAINAAKLDPDVTTELQAGLATASALATAQTSIDDLPTSAELSTALGTADDAVLAQVALVKAQTDKLTFTVPLNLDVNIQYVNDVEVAGTGAGGDEWGPA